MDRKKEKENENQIDKIVFIVGSTATGKTRLSCALANKFNG